MKILQIICDGSHASYYSSILPLDQSKEARNEATRSIERESLSVFQVKQKTLKARMFITALLNITIDIHVLCIYMYKT